MLDQLLTRYIESQVYTGVVENIACEMSARMVAMKSASDNAGELIDELELIYNKARQAAITQELSEIVAGACCGIVKERFLIKIFRENTRGTKTMSSGKIVQIIGAVLDVEFPSDAIPKIYDALKVEGEGVNTTLEVQQQLGDGVVRTIALGSTDGLKRGLTVNNTGEAISIPVGTKTLGRIMNVLGEPIDEVGPIDTDERMVIHRDAPKFTELEPIYRAT